MTCHAALIYVNQASRPWLLTKETDRVAMDAYLARENIKRFRAQLRASDNEAQQGVLRTLIKAEQDHLKLIFAAERARPE